MELFKAYFMHFKQKEREFEPRASKYKKTIIRLDGKKFHKYTEHFMKPFDIFMQYLLVKGALYVIKRDIPEVDYLYQLSDEISLIIDNAYVKCQDSPRGIEECVEKYKLGFGGRTGKLNSILASRLSVTFNFLVREFYEQTKKGNVPNFLMELHLSSVFKINCLKQGETFTKECASATKDLMKYARNILSNRTDLNYLAVFDCRVFQVESEKELENYFIWRRMDAIRNSKNMLGQYFYSHKKLHNLSSNEIIEKVAKELGFHYYRDLPTFIKRGVFINLRNEKRFGFNEDDELTAKFLHSLLED